MLKKETLSLLNTDGLNYKNIFSICIGKSYLFQSRFIDYICICQVKIDPFYK